MQGRCEVLAWKTTHTQQQKKEQNGKGKKKGAAAGCRLVNSLKDGRLVMSPYLVVFNAVDVSVSGIFRREIITMCIITCLCGCQLDRRPVRHEGKASLSPPSSQFKEILLKCGKPSLATVPRFVYCNWVGVVP